MSNDFYRGTLPLHKPQFASNLATQFSPNLSFAPPPECLTTSTRVQLPHSTLFLKNRDLVVRVERWLDLGKTFFLSHKHDTLRYRTR